MIPPEVAQKIKELIERAERYGRKDIKPRSAVRNGSSLHKIIRTKEQAERFMRSLKAAENS
ncbi:MAG TPA: hypothetical protein VHC96_22025 [Puia sp.]|jgi:hypothetical protein|nr:hypothetical protein [Puia sp.]